MKVPSNLVRDIRKYYCEQLCSVYDNDEATAMILILLEHYFKITRVKMALEPDMRLSESEMLTFHFAVKDLLKNKPIQYIIGETEFCDLKFKVNENAPIGKTNISVSTGNGDVVITKNSIPNFDFDVKDASIAISVVNSGAHTCVGGSPVKQDEILATCTTDGSYYSVVTCTTCNAELSREKVTIPKLGHKPGSEVKENETAPNCFFDGGYDLVKYCTVCNEEVKRDKVTIPKLTHKESAEIKEDEVPATCTAVGKYDSVVRCTICNTIISKTTVIIPINNNHKPGTAIKENEKPGTCQSTAKYDLVVYCIECNAEISRKTETAGKGEHVPGVPEILYEESTCIKKGSITEISKCSVCSTELSRKVTELELTDHVRLPSPVKENVIEATCLKSGSYLSVVKCSVCSANLSSEVVQVDKLPHAPAKAVEENRKESTCTVAGSYDLVVKCSECSEELSKETITLELANHNYADATCDAPATCTVCGKTTDGNPLGHEWEEVTYTWSADGKSCTATRVCTRSSDHTETATATVTSVVATEATCTEMGTTTYTATFDKEWAVSVTTSIKDIPSTGHKYDAVVTAPTCSAGGYTTYTCACGDTYVGNKVDAVDHHGNLNGGKYISPTCMKDGIIIYVCEDCGTEYNSTIIPARGHRYVDAETEIIEATCDKSGVKISYQECYYCGLVDESTYSETEFGKPKGHYLYSHEGYEATCTKDGLSDYSYCLREGCDYQEHAKVIPATGHTDNGEGKCEDCGSLFYGNNGSKVCTCICHSKSFIAKIVFKILNFFWKLFKINHKCDCGTAHY